MVVLLSAVSCGLFEKKEPISAEDFTVAMENEGYTVEDVTADMKDQPKVVKCLIALSDNYQIEYYETKDEANARSMFSINKEQFESEFGGTGASKSEVNINNQAKFTMNSNDMYYFLSQIDNTIIYLKIDKEYKDEVNQILKSIGQKLVEAPERSGAFFMCIVQMKGIIIKRKPSRRNRYAIYLLPTLLDLSEGSKMAG